MVGPIFWRFLSHGVNFNSQIVIQFLIAVPVCETLEKSHFNHWTSRIRTARTLLLQSYFRWWRSEIISVTYMQEHCKRKHLYVVLQFLKCKVSQLWALSIQAMLNELSLTLLHFHVIAIHKFGLHSLFCNCSGNECYRSWLLKLILHIHVDCVTGNWMNCF
jgi:hypothetical protein